MNEKEQKTKILIVDDVAENIHILIETLKDSYTIMAVNNGEKALKLASKENKPDLILLDILMPDMDGYEVCKRLKSNNKTQNIPIIFITALSEDINESQGLKLGAVDYITKPFMPELVKSRIDNHIQLKLYRDHLEHLVEERTKEIYITQDVTINSLAILAEYRDNETGGHIRRTQYYIKLLAEQLQKLPKYKNELNPFLIETLFKSAPLHDIGKVAIPDNILLKPGKLTPEEFEIMKKHTILGKEALEKAEATLNKTNSFLRCAREIAYTHHEKWDGTGYPNGLKGEDIPLSGRIMALGDVYDALISKRVYKKAFTHEVARSIIIEERGKHFDPDVVDIFIEFDEEWRKIALKYADYEEEKEALMAV
jgi:putative two-component system response regulator